MDVILLMLLVQIRYNPDNFHESSSGLSPWKLEIFSNVRRAIAGVC